MGYITDLSKAFNVTLKQFGVDNSIEVALNNIDMPTDTSIPFLAGFQLPAPVDSADLGVNDSRIGVYQIDINYASHLGDPPVNKMADLLNETFKTGSYITFGSVCVGVDSFSPGDIPISNGWATMSCTINWTSYTAVL